MLLKSFWNKVNQFKSTIYWIALSRYVLPVVRVWCVYVCFPLESQVTLGITQQVLDPFARSGPRGKSGPLRSKTASCLHLASWRCSQTSHWEHCVVRVQFSCSALHWMILKLHCQIACIEKRKPPETSFCDDFNLTTSQDMLLKISEPWIHFQPQGSFAV